MSTIHSDGPTIEIPFPERKFKKVIKELGIKYKKNLNKYSKDNKKKIFLSALSHWQVGHISLDEMAEIAMQLHDIQGEDQELEDVLYKCSEWNFYVRRIDTIDTVEQKTGNFIWFMTDVIKYYKKYNN